ncbi:hypothetical protein AMAG_14420 [Allomyces macrogynus ATCC 38327]|uniref:Cyclin n=1 Tax=Allomyces macrogynus (strain ATCC 38327) TaxID=578462 RepID=A0A0L0T6F8_ALLM3|nr:hypothetical protein AMAG_14420 [Allomyces macrogynus ATCC 38327]|eukprot:KNE70271.1 hypothetical protein AMAG_14420 [Allomyces macrogynus ATCC 38327]
MYLDRLARKPLRAVVVTSANVRRLLITVTMVATKYWSDVFYTNAHYAQVGGLHVVQLNRLELQILMLLDYDLKLEPADFVRYADRLHVHSFAAAATRDTTQAAAAAMVSPGAATTNLLASHVPRLAPALSLQRQISNLDVEFDVEDDPTLSPEQRAALAEMRTITIMPGDDDKDVITGKAEAGAPLREMASTSSPILASGAAAQSHGSRMSSNVGRTAMIAPRVARKRSARKRMSGSLVARTLEGAVAAELRAVASVTSPTEPPLREQRACRPS